MELKDRVVVVTGAARGIGAAIARRFHAEGAQVVVADREIPSPATDLPPAVDMHELDVSDAGALSALVDQVEERLGPIEVFVANAGVAGGGGLDAADDVWSACWQVNLLAHVHAARIVVPKMLARGGGTFVTTASAAGLLMNLGNAPYSVSKHAAVAFAEWLAVEYADEGLRVHCICPMGVDTAMLRAGEGTLEGASVKALGVLPVEAVPEALFQAMESGRFLVLTHPETAAYEQHRVADRDRWLAGMRKSRRTVLGSLNG